MPLAETLEILLGDWRKLLSEWAASGQITAAAQEALQLDGEPELLQELVGEWSKGDFSELPPIVLIPSSSMPGAAGAYAISTGTIYLNEDWLADATFKQALSVLTEELGHHLDALLNRADTIGDEGQYFSRLIIEQPPKSASLPELRTEDDRGLVNHENKNIATERSTTTIPIFNAPPVSYPFGIQTRSQSYQLNPRLADFDADGDLDLLMGSRRGYLDYFENIGSKSAPAFGAGSFMTLGLYTYNSKGLYTYTSQGITPLTSNTSEPTVYETSPAIVDIDGDGDLDIFIGLVLKSNFKSEFRFYRNIGTPTAPDFSDKPIIGGSHPHPLTFPFGIQAGGQINHEIREHDMHPSFADIDADGDFDLLIGRNFYLNVGNRTSPLFAAPLKSPYGITTDGQLDRPKFWDVDGDGDYDLMFGSSDGYYYLQQNIGTEVDPHFASPIQSPFDLARVTGVSMGKSYDISPEVADIDGDGDWDLLTGAGLGESNRYYGQLLFYENKTSSNNAPTDIYLDSSGVSEDSSEGAVVGILSASDQDEGSSFSYSLIAGEGDTDNELVIIDGATIRVRAGSVIDFETNSELNLRIQVMDNGGLTYSKPFNVNVMDSATDEASGEIFITIDAISDAGNLAGESISVGSEKISDPDGIKQILYAWESSSDLGKTWNPILIGNSYLDAAGSIVVGSQVHGKKVRLSAIAIDLDNNVNNEIVSNVIEIPYENVKKAELRYPDLTHEPLLLQEGLAFKPEELFADRLFSDSLFDGIVFDEFPYNEENSIANNVTFVNINLGFTVEVLDSSGHWMPWSDRVLYAGSSYRLLLKEREGESIDIKGRLFDQEWILDLESSTASVFHKESWSPTGSVTTFGVSSGQKPKRRVYARPGDKASFSLDNPFLAHRGDKLIIDATITQHQDLGMFAELYLEDVETKTKQILAEGVNVVASNGKYKIVGTVTDSIKSEKIYEKGRYAGNYVTMASIDLRDVELVPFGFDLDVDWSNYSVTDSVPLIRLTRSTLLKEEAPTDLAIPMDFTGDGEVDETDALLMMRHMMGTFPGDAITQGIPGITDVNGLRDKIMRTMEQSSALGGGRLDIDGDGMINPFSDGMMILKHIHGKGQETPGGLPEIPDFIKNPMRDMNQMQTHLKDLIGF